MTQKGNEYDLEERTAQFGENAIELCKKVKISPTTGRIVDQLVGAATSVGANYAEANGASSKRDFRNKITYCKKEAQESKHWLRMLAKAVPDLNGECQKLWKEAQELTLIFHAIEKSSRANK